MLPREKGGQGRSLRLRTPDLVATAQGPTAQASAPHMRCRCPPGRDCALTYRLLFPRDLFSLSSLPLCTWWPPRTQGWQMEGWAGTCL